MNNNSNKQFAKGNKNAKTGFGAGDEKEKRQTSTKRQSKLSEYGKQLKEKQKVKRMYGMLEKQFKRFFGIATQQQGVTGDNLLALLERRLDNTVFRLKLAVNRVQARQIVVHGHVTVNGRKVHSPSFSVSVGDVIGLKDSVLKKEKFLEEVIDKRLNIGIKVPEWLELDKNNRKGSVLRNPVRSDIQVPIEEHLIVELYSK